LEDEEKREIDEAHWVLDNVEDAKEWVVSPVLLVGLLEKICGK
jgi:hypothetical protein